MIESNSDSFINNILHSVVDKLDKDVEELSELDMKMVDFRNKFCDDFDMTINMLYNLAESTMINHINTKIKSFLDSRKFDNKILKLQFHANDDILFGFKTTFGNRFLYEIHDKCGIEIKSNTNPFIHAINSYDPNCMWEILLFAGDEFGIRFKSDFIDKFKTHLDNLYTIPKYNKVLTRLANNNGKLLYTYEEEFLESLE